jgi:chromatin segregation and condensation protein Rec8/ScpA/Scc1 (kleisin family)
MKHRDSQMAAVEPEPPPRLEQSDPLLTAAVREHVERAARFLSQIEEAKPDQAETRVRKSVASGDIDDLIADSRLYRQTAEQEHDTEIAKLLGEVEALLVDLQHASGGAAPVSIRDIQQRILRSDLEGKLKSAGQIGTSDKVRGTLL